MSGTSPVVRSTDTRDAPSVTHAVVAAVADADGVPQSQVGPPLASVIDPDALEAFVASLDGRSTAPASIAFTYRDYRVTVHGDGSVTLSELRPEN